MPSSRIGEVVKFASVPQRRPGCGSRCAAATEDLLVQFLAVFLVYAVVRNFAVDEHALKRLAWVGFAAGPLAALTQHLAGDRERVDGRDELRGGLAPSSTRTTSRSSCTSSSAFPSASFSCPGPPRTRAALTASRRTPRWSRPHGRGDRLQRVVLAGPLPCWNNGSGLAIRRTLRGLVTGDSNYRRIGLVLMGGVVLAVGLLTAWLGWSRFSIVSPASGRAPPTTAATSGPARGAWSYNSR